LAGTALADAHAMDKLPQRLVNVKVADRDSLAGAVAVWDQVGKESAALEGRGRVLLRPSGTEPLVRVMVEAPEADEADAVCDRLVALVEQELG
jgi:phosphoglucosamine mutase